MARPSYNGKLLFGQQSTDAEGTKENEWTIGEWREGYGFCEGISSTFTCTGLLAGIWYDFKVRCRNAIGWSSWTGASERHRTLALPPDKVMDVVCDGMGSRFIDVRWSKPRCNGETIDRYEVQHQGRLDSAAAEASQGLSSSSEWTTLCETSALQTRHDPLLPVSVHRYRVRARNAAWGPGPPSTWIQTSPAVPSVPNPPVCINKTESILWISWTHSYSNVDASIDNGSGIEAYEVQYITPREKFWVCVSDSLDVMEVMVTELKPVVEHTFRVRALNGEGWSAWSVLANR